MLEKHVQQTCTEFLELDGWLNLRTDPVSDRARGKGFGELGMPDNQYRRPALAERLIRDRILSPHVGVTMPASYRAVTELMWIEWKRPRKSKTAAHQITWHTQALNRGELVFLAGVDFDRTIEGFEDWYRNKSGLMIRSIRIPR